MGKKKNAEKNLKEEYEKINKYLKKYKDIDSKYDKYLEDLCGISLFYTEVKILLKQLRKEEEYEFFGKILINTTYTKDKISELIADKKYFIPITSEEEYKEFEKEMSKSENENSIIDLDECVNKINGVIKENFDIEEDIIVIEDLNGLESPYNPSISLRIIKTLEDKIKPIFEKRDKDKKIENIATFLDKKIGISKNLKGTLSKEIDKKSTNKKYKTNLKRIGLKEILK